MRLADLNTTTEYAYRWRLSPMPTTEQLAELGQAVLDEHRAALLYEQNLQDPDRKADAEANAEHVRKLLREML